MGSGIPGERKSGLDRFQSPFRRLDDPIHLKTGPIPGKILPKACSQQCGPHQNVQKMTQVEIRILQITPALAGTKYPARLLENGGLAG